MSNILNKVISELLLDRIKGVYIRLFLEIYLALWKEKVSLKMFFFLRKLYADIKLKGKSFNLVIKLDMAKAYDRVAWKFLLTVLAKLGFDSNEVDKIWRVLTNNWYSILINGCSLCFFSILLEEWSRVILYPLHCSFWLHKYCPKL